jgi:hypothetical protein
VLDGLEFADGGLPLSAILTSKRDDSGPQVLRSYDTVGDLVAEKGYMCGNEAEQDCDF